MRFTAVCIKQTKIGLGGYGKKVKKIRSSLLIRGDNMVNVEFILFFSSDRENLMIIIIETSS